MSDLLDAQFSQLKNKYNSAEIQRKSDGSALIRIPKFPLVSGWNREEATVTFVVPVGYPFARPDSFWADEDLRLANGGMPANAGVNANYGESKPLLWFSFHAGVWDPNLDNLFTYAKLIRQRLSQSR